MSLLRRLFFAPLLLVACSGDGGDDGVDPPGVDPLELVTEALPDGAFGQAYDQKVGARGGQPPYSFSITSGALPDGLMLKSDTGQISGVANAAGRAELTLQVADSGGRTATKDYAIYVTPAALEITTADLPNGDTETFYDVTLEATGGVEPFSWSVASGALPAGLALGSAGRISGTPTRTGMFDVTARVTDAEGTTAEASYTFSVASANPIITGGMLPYARSGDPYDVTLEVMGGTAPYTWAVTGGALPPGLTLAAEGRITGTPTDSGEFRFMVEVTDANERTDAVELIIFSIGPLIIDTTSLPLAILGDPYEVELSATGGLEPYAWFVAPTTPLPAGLTLSEEGTISGTPTEAGDFDVRIRLQDATGALRSTNLVLRVRDLRIYTAGAGETFPPLCTTSTHVSYQVVELEVAESFAIADMNVTLDIDYNDSSTNVINDKLRVFITGPDGRQVVICGNSTGVRGGTDCGGTSEGVHATYGTLGATPERPLDVFFGTNAQGTWRLRVAVVGPSTAGGNCEQAGAINEFTLTISPDTSPDPYVRVTGYNPNNLLIDPWLRISGGGQPMSDLFLAATLWTVGPNGRREGAQGDDVPDPRSFTWTGTSLPAGTSITPDGHVVAGAITGRNLLPTVTASDGGSVNVTLPLHVVPPDWNPDIREF